MPHFHDYGGSIGAWLVSAILGAMYAVPLPSQSKDAPAESYMAGSLTRIHGELCTWASGSAVISDNLDLLRDFGQEASCFQKSWMSSELRTEGL